MPTHAEIYSKVSAALVESLGAEETEIKPGTRLMKDLGAESIDFLDILFRLENEFDIEIPRGELFPESVFRGDPSFVQDGRLTDNGLAELRSRMPYADLHEFEGDPQLKHVSDLFTVNLLTRYVQSKLGQGTATAGAGAGS